MQNVPNGVEMWLQVAGETFPNGPQKPVVLPPSYSSLKMKVEVSLSLSLYSSQAPSLSFPGTEACTATIILQIDKQVLLEPPPHDY